MNTPALLMQRCLDLARRGAGAVSPNPLVGCVLVDDGGVVLGEGWHRQFGGPHAEVNAIADAEARHGATALQTATLYVNLEPCAHHGKTPPCADLIVEKRIPRVVVGMPDPFPKVDGRGIEKLRAAGVEVVVGVEEAACRRLNEAFVHHVATDRPLVCVKVAQTLDGFAATATGDSRWVTEPDARARVHAMRATLDAVLVGSGTARADDPALTVRHVEGRQPLRLVLDRTGALPASLRLFTDENAAQTVAVVAEGIVPAYAGALEDRGGRVLQMPATNHHLDLGALLDALGRGDAERPVQSLLVEAGPRLAAALFEADLVDRFYCFIAPKLLGGGQPATRFPGAAKMADARAWPDFSWETIGSDVLFTGYRNAF